MDPYWDPYFPRKGPLGPLFETNPRTACATCLTDITSETNAKTKAVVSTEGVPPAAAATGRYAGAKISAGHGGKRMVG